MKNQNSQDILSDEEVRKLVLARLAVLSSNTMMSFGSEGSFSRDELVASVERGDKLGEKLAEMEMEWLRSFKSVAA